MHLTILGIRHHGVGSARYVVDALAQLRPDLLLVEGPTELDAALTHLAHADLQPPVAMLAYNPDQPRQALFYPFAEFSPEWQAMQWAARANVPTRQIDLPLAHVFGQKKETDVPVHQDQVIDNQLVELRETEPSGEAIAALEPVEPLPESTDSLLPLAQADGYTDSETWWEHHVEQRYGAGLALAHFEAVQQAMTALREQARPDTDNDRREAAMRQGIRQAATDGFQRVVVVCGAWHGPALTGWESTKKADALLLKNLPKAPVAVTWIPWTYDRLGWRSGYGAGITSPGWYDHVWHHPTDTGIRWLTHVARLFRANKMDTSTAHVIEAYRLAESLAALRGQPRPGLVELNEATQTVLCFGDGILLKLVEAELIVGKKMGRVPDDVPKLPIQADFEEQARKLRLVQTGEMKVLELDLRKEMDLSRSRFLHRLNVLGAAWGQLSGGRTKGTFKEVWQLTWQPSLVLQLIEKAIYGNGVADAATAFLLEKSSQSTRIGELAELVQLAIPAELFGAIGPLLTRLGDLATLAADVLDLMQAFTPLVDISRYGNVRNTDLTVINQLVSGLITRVCIGLPNACYGLDADNAALMLTQIRLVNDATRLLDDEELRPIWLGTLRGLLAKADRLKPDGTSPGIHALLAGGTCRLLFDGHELTEADTARAFGLALSVGSTPAYAAAWLEGFLTGSGLILLYDHTLWNLLFKWVADLPPAQFGELLPILRRTFARFDPADRRQLGAKAKQGVIIDALPTPTTAATNLFNTDRASRTLAVVRELLGS